MRKYKVSQRIWALVLSVVMILGMLPVTAYAAATDAVVRQADPSTMNEYRELFLDPDVIGVELTTENAGGIWTDKSVFSADNIPGELTGAISEENTKISVKDTGDNFLVALSAIASNKEIVGYSTIPTDTVLILDMSSSMRSNDDNGQSAIDELVDATNKAMTDLLALNHNNRVAVVLYAGNVQEQWASYEGATQVILPLDRYTTTTAGKFLQAVNVGSNVNWGLKTLINGKEAKEVTVEFTNTYEAPSTPVTGDTFNLPLTMTLMFVSMGGILMILLSKKQKGGKYAR